MAEDKISPQAPHISVHIAMNITAIAVNIQNSGFLTIDIKIRAWGP